LLKLSELSLSHELLELLLAGGLMRLLSLPHIKGSLHILGCIFVKVVPDLLNSISLEMVSVSSVPLVLSPSIKDCCLKPVAVHDH